MYSCLDGIFFITKQCVFNWLTGLANATAILEESYQEYPNSAVFLFFRGLVSRLKVGSLSYQSNLSFKSNDM